MENRTPSPSLPQLLHSTSPVIPPRFTSPFPIPQSTEDGATDEEIDIKLETKEALFPRGKDLQPKLHIFTVKCVTYLSVFVFMFSSVCFRRKRIRPSLSS